MTIALEDVLTESQLDEAMGGRITRTHGVLPAAWESAEPARRLGLERVLTELMNRHPPIFEADISTPSQLRTAVQYAAMSQLYELAATSGGEAELYFALFKSCEERYRQTMAGIKLTTGTGARMTSSTGISRR